MALLRGFPLLLLPALWLAGRTTAAIAGASTFLGVNLIGMAAFGLGPADVWAGVTAGAELFGSDSHNASLAGILTRFGLPFGSAAVSGCPLR
jgi:hypothetical protein